MGDTYLLPFVAAFAVLLVRTWARHPPKNDETKLRRAKIRIVHLAKQRPLVCDVCMSIWSTVPFLFCLPSFPSTFNAVFLCFCVFVLLRLTKKLMTWSEPLKTTDSGLASKLDKLFMEEGTNVEESEINRVDEAVRTKHRDTATDAGSGI